MQREIVSREAWIEARLRLLEDEKALTRSKDRVNAARLALPWVRIEKDYVFDAPQGKRALGDLFGGRSQLFVKHFMMAPGAKHQCVGCSLEVDHMTDLLPHLENHDVSYVVVARAPIDEIETVRKRMGWRFPWVSSFASDFNYDFGASFRQADVDAGTALYNFQAAPDWAAGMADLSGNSVFYRNAAGEIFHAYSAFARGGEQFLGVYGILDVMPKGRNETGPYHSLTDWARPRDMYGAGGEVEANGRYHAPSCACATHGPASRMPLQAE